MGDPVMHTIDVSGYLVLDGIPFYDQQWPGPRTVFECGKCAALVVTPHAHAAWHAGERC